MPRGVRKSTSSTHALWRSAANLRRVVRRLVSRSAASGRDQLRQVGRGGAALKCQQIKGRGLATGQNRQASMGLPAMMGLMIEQMLEYVRNGLGVGHARCRPVTVDAGQRSVVIRIDRADEPFILNYARSDKLGAIFEQDSIQSAWMVALTGQSFQPDTIRQ